MSYSIEHKKKFDDLKYILENRNQLKLKANGGNSIVFAYPPQDEDAYINQAMDIYNDEGVFINLADIMVKFLEDLGIEEFEYLYKEFGSQVFKPTIEDSDDPNYFDYIINEIASVGNEEKIPFLIRTGSLMGTGIENVSIIEHKSIIQLQNPLVVFYPATLEGDNLMFLGVKPSSRYRCHLIY